MVNNLLSETLSESQRRIMDDLFIKLSSCRNDQENGTNVDGIYRLS